LTAVAFFILYPLKFLMESTTSFEQFSKNIQNGDATCVAIVNHFLSRIEELNPTFNVFLEVYADEAKNRAEEVDKKIKEGTAGKLAGMVIGIKDVLAYRDHGLQASSKILNGFKSQFTATAVQRLLDEDAIIIGRQNCDEFAMGSSNENSAFGVTRNFADKERVPGGSSGASAVAVQSGMCHASIGSDTGGSVRQPAAFCGVVGFKPSYGRISRWGLAAYASSFDCIGSITNSVKDAALLLEVMAGADDFDSTVSTKEVEKYSKNLDDNPAKFRIGYFKEALDSEGLDSEVKAKTLEKIEALKSAGHTVEAVDFPLLKYLLPTYYILTTAEASSNLSRYDGVRYGYRAENVKNLEELYKKSRSEGFGSEVKRRIMLGTFVLSADYYDAYYTKAQRVRQLIKNATDELLENYDFIISPTTPSAAFKIGDKKEDPIQMYLADIYTVQANVIGYPAISVPNGTDKRGLPIGFQVLGKEFAEHKLLKFAKTLSEV
jgi:aspartyl-tRNA(Asn)/glutamyl-tRNA(Gln) amidotransferase subunit A